MPKANMSKSNLENGQARIKAEKIFTDREAPRESFWKSYEEIANDMENYKVLTYYGIGGIGKTTLIGILIQEVNEKKAKYVSINFEHYESLSKILILRDLGAKLFKLDKNRFKFYRFRFAMKRYAEETGQSLEIKNDNSSFLTNNPLLELGMDLSQNVPDLIEKLPIISTISKAITILDKSREIIKNKIDTRNMKKSLIEIQILEIAQIVKNIEKYFYEDLAEAMLNSKEPLVIFLDTYEKFADSFCNSEYKSSEEWLKSIVSKPQGILWVITGRERINWEEEFEAEQHLLENLSYKDASDFLVTAGVDKELTEKIYELTSGNPVFLDVCVDRYVELINKGKTPTINDFGERKFGINSWDELPDNFGEKQFLDENYKTEFGESQKEVRERTFNALMNVLKSDDKKIAIVFHGTAMLFLLMTWCKVVPDSDKYKIFFNGNELLWGKHFDFCETFKLTFDDENKLINIENIKHD